MIITWIPPENTNEISHYVIKVREASSNMLFSSEETSRTNLFVILESVVEYTVTVVAENDCGTSSSELLFSIEAQGKLVKMWVDVW